MPKNFLRHTQTWFLLPLALEQELVLFRRSVISALQLIFEVSCFQEIELYQCPAGKLWPFLSLILGYSYVRIQILPLRCS